MPSPTSFPGQTSREDMHKRGNQIIRYLSAGRSAKQIMQAFGLTPAEYYAGIDFMKKLMTAETIPQLMFKHGLYCGVKPEDNFR